MFRSFMAKHLVRSVPPVEQDYFSKELVAETIKCFKEENHVILSEEEAITVLKSFGRLFLAFSDTIQGIFGAASAARKFYDCSTLY